MLPIDDLYYDIWDNPAHYAETKLIINGTEYGQNYIRSIKRSQALFGDEYRYGTSVMNEIEFSLFGVFPDDVPKMSRVEVWTRLLSPGGLDSTEWLPMGVYYTKTPTFDPEAPGGGILTTTGYDEMFRTQVIPYEVGAEIYTWNSPTMADVAKHLIEGEEIPGVIEDNFAGCGLLIEDESQIEPFEMSSIPFGYTVREILDDIALASGGNWVVVFADEGAEQVAKLRLVRFEDVSAVDDLDRNVQTFTQGDEIMYVSYVSVFFGYDDSGKALYAGYGDPDDTEGRQVDCTIQTITDATVAEAIAENIYNQYNSINYAPFEATGCELNPAIELGDPIYVNGLSSYVCAIDTRFNQAMFADISAPGLSEEDTFGYTPVSARKEARLETQVRSKITQTEDAIKAYVDDGNNSTRVLINAEGVRIDSVSSAVESVNDRLTEFQDNLGTYLAYSSENGLILGNEQTGARAQLNEDKLSFITAEGGEVAHIGASDFEITQGRVYETLKYGDHWQITANQSDNHLTIKWRT